MYLATNIRKSFRPIYRYMKFKVLHIDDSPERIARGVAVGLFVAWTPLLGLHILLSILLSTIFKANKIAALLFVWISNAATLVVIYYPGYFLGRTIVSLFGIQRSYSVEQVKGFFAEIANPKSLLSGVFSADFWKNFCHFFMEIGLELTIGGCLLGLLIATLGYFVSYKVIVWHRVRKPHRRYRRHS